MGPSAGGAYGAAILSSALALVGCGAPTSSSNATIDSGKASDPASSESSPDASAASQTPEGGQAASDGPNGGDGQSNAIGQSEGGASDGAEGGADGRATSTDGGSAPSDGGTNGRDGGATQLDAHIDAPANDGGSLSDGGPTYRPCPTNGSACAIMPLGDSITFGTTYAGSYRVQLFHLALADSKLITFVGSMANGPATVDGSPFPRNNEGHSGYIITLQTGWSGLNPKVTDIIPPYKPNIILLMIGTNDINGSVDVANAPARLGTLIDVLAAGSPNALIVVAQIIPTQTAQTNTRVDAYNAAIPSVVHQHAAAGKHVIVVDMNTPFTSNPNFQSAYLLNDLHPNPAGFTVMGNTWYAAIKNLL